MSRTGAIRTALAVLAVAALAGTVIVARRSSRPSDNAGRDQSSTTSIGPLAPTTTTTTTSPAEPTIVAPPSLAPGPPGADAPVVASSTGVVLPVVARVANGWRVVTPCGRTTEIAGATPIPAATVVLDAGHGGDEPGAVAPTGLREKAINLAVVGHAREALARAGVSVVLTRTADYRITLESRARIVTALKPRAFVSIHHNAEPDGPRDSPGTETYYQVASADSRRLAGLLYEEVFRTMAQYSGVAWTADTDAGAKYRRNDAGDDYYGILRRTHGVPSVLGELLMMADTAEAELLARPEVQQAEGEAVARAVVRFLTTRDPGSGYTEPYARTTPAGGGGGSSGCTDPPL